MEAEGNATRPPKPKRTRSHIKPKRTRSHIKIPSWKDRMDELTKFLRTRSDGARILLQDDSSVSEVLLAARVEYERAKLKFEMLEAKYQLQKQSSVAPMDMSSSSSSSESLASLTSSTSALFQTLEPHTTQIPRPASSFIADLTYREGFLHAPFPFTALTPSFRLVDCNLAFIDDMRIFPPPASKNNPQFFTRQWLTTQTRPVVEMMGIEGHEEDCPYEHRVMDEQVMVALSQGRASARRVKQMSPTGDIVRVDLALWTTYEKDANGDDLLNRPICVNIVTFRDTALRHPRS